MARSRFPTAVTDLISDEGNVLWSFPQGEQLEFPITLNFIEDITTTGYVYEAAVVEGLNVPSQISAPDDTRSGGVNDALTVRVPTFIGTWNPAVGYNKEEIVLAGGVYFKLLGGSNRVEATAPASDPEWEITNLQTIYVQFDSAIGATWTVQPSVSNPCYGFFELRVTEPTDAVFTRTWKPVRGTVELLFSPTHVTPDVP